MPVIAREPVASDHLVYAWPFPIGPEDHEVSCAEDELVVMCPAWLVGDRLGPGRHRWRTPDPTRPVGAYFVLTAPVEVSFDMITQFMIPTTGHAVRLRAQGLLQVRCMDPALLVAQFVGLPFDSVNDGVLRSVSRSIERMLARLLTRRVVMAGTPQAVTDPAMLQNIIEELVAYNPTAGAVFGVELMRFGHMSIAADDGSRPWQQMGMSNGDPSRGDTKRTPPPRPEIPLLETVRGPRPADIPAVPKAVSGEVRSGEIRSGEIRSGEIRSGEVRSGEIRSGEVRSGEIRSGESRATKATLPPPPPTPPKRAESQPSASGEIGPKPRAQTFPQSETSGEINVKAPAPAPAKKTVLGHVAVPSGAAESGPTATPKPAPPALPPKTPTLDPNRPLKTPTPSGRRAAGVEVQATDETTQPGIDILRTPLPGSLQAPMASSPSSSSSSSAAAAVGTPPPPASVPVESRGSIMGIGMSHIGSAEVASGEITKKIAPGGRVLVPGPNGLMQSATVRQLLQGYYELEVGGSGETIWVPVNGVVPE